MGKEVVRLKKNPVQTVGFVFRINGDDYLSMNDGMSWKLINMNDYPIIKRLNHKEVDELAMYLLESKEGVERGTLV